MSLGNVGSPMVPMTWLSHGWSTLRELAHDALTRFEHEHEGEQDEAAKAEVPHAWGLVAVDVVEHGNDVEVRMEVPGLGKDDLNVEVQGNVVAVSGERRMSNSRRVGNTLVTERAFGRFSRRIPLSIDVDASGCSAELEHGVLVITLPKKENAEASKVSIK